MAYGLTKSADLERGSSQSFERADNSLLQGGGNFTIEAWVNLESATTSAAFVIASKRDSGNQRSFVWKVNDAGTMSLQASSSGGSFDGDTSVSWTESTATWIHLAVTFDGTADEVKFYLDGSQQGTTQAPGISSVHDDTGPFSIGRESTGGDYFDGKISLLRFWQETRTAAEIDDNKCEVLGSTTNLSAEWTLDDTANDNSGNSLTLTNNNSTPFATDVPSTCGVSFIPTIIMS